MFVGVLKAIKGGKIEVEQKKSFLPDIHRVNMGLRGLGCGQYKRTTFKGFLCIFLKILAKDMGKPLVPAVPRHLGHLGHPTVYIFFANVCEILIRFKFGIASCLTSFAGDHQ